MIETVRKVLALLSVGERKGLYWLILAIIIMAIFDMIGVASIFPFLHVIANPEVIQTNDKLRWVYGQFGFTNKDTFLIALGLASFTIMLVNNIFRAGISIALIRFVWLKRVTISKRLFSRYLYEPYVFFLNRNTSELMSYLAVEVAHVVSYVILPCMQIFARSLLAILILGLLIAVDPMVATVVIVVIGGGYAVIYFFVRKKLLVMGDDTILYGKQVYKTLNEAFGGIKDVKLLGKEHVFVEQFDDPMKKTANHYCSQYKIHQIPRYAFEVLAFGGIILITVYLIAVKNDYQQVIPLVGLYALAAYRLMPAVQQIFNDLTLIRFGRSMLDTIHQDYVACKHHDYEKFIKSGHVLPFAKNIELRNITFQYPKAQKSVIENLSLNIKAKTTVGFVGGTGAGKTTLIDILLGLLWPRQGELFVDGIQLNEENLRMWQKNIGYVPQNIYLCDDTITHNIAFGIPDNEIDQEAVVQAAQLANIHHFIKNELPNEYATEVGERGVRLSGGQRQRVGIARALYHNPSLLVFDEATSALDGITENTILEAIYNLTHKKTIIIIAHRLSTVKDCDIIYLLEKGKIVDQGTHKELLANNQQFRRMADAHAL